ncbi:MAG: hypothetical protein V2A66_01970 [Pseudomonadota bacterium]
MDQIAEAMVTSEYSVLVIVLVSAVLFFGAIGLSIYLLKRWNGFFRIAAALPVLVLTGFIAVVSIGIAKDPTSHNLWPFELVMWGGGTFIYLGLVALLKRFVAIKRNKQG